MLYDNQATERLTDFTEQCHIELTLLEEIAAEIALLLADIRATDKHPSVRNRAAAANLTQSFYNGVENILKRTSKYFGIPLPKTEQWHSELAQRFTKENHFRHGFPILLVPEIVTSVTILRRFRHVIMHGYAMNLDWERMSVNVELVSDIFPSFRTAVEEFLAQEQRRITPPT
jgi:hypothetical protein